MPDAPPNTNLDLQEVATRNEHAHHIIAGFASAKPLLADIWHFLDQALNDVPALSAEIARLTAELHDAWLDRANLIAAMRATLAAHADGEPDPLWYLRDELEALSGAPKTPSAATRRRG
jgi:hypothetical protein